MGRNNEAADHPLAARGGSLRRGPPRQRRVRLVRARQPLRAGAMQLFLIGIGVALGVPLPRIHTGAQTPSGRTVEFLLTIGFGILGLVSIIFSLLFLVVEYSNTALTPRLNLFQGDPWIWRTYGACLGLFTFGFVATLSIGDRTQVSVIVPVVSLVVALVVIGLMRRLQVKAFDSMQLNATLSAISGAGREVIDNVYPAGITIGSPGDAVDVMEGGRPVTWDRPGATLEQLDLRKILNSSAAGDRVAFEVAVGRDLVEGSVVARVTGGFSDDLVLAACLTGDGRTFNQDPLLAFRLLSDIGLRALSPAINDPATAGQTIEAIAALLVPLAERDLEVGVIYTADGRPTVWLDVPEWTEYVTEGLDELLIAFGRSPLVLAKAKTLLSRVAKMAAESRKAAIEVRLSWIRERLGEADPFAGHQRPGSSPAWLGRRHDDGTT